MNQQIYNFPDHIKGDTFEGLNFTINVNGNPLDLTGAEIAMQLRNSNSQNSIADFNTTNFKIIITDAVAGKFRLIKQIINILARTYNYDIEITMQNGDVFTYIKGTWTITQDITHG